MSIAFLQFETKSWCYKAHEVGIVGMPVSIRGAAEHTSMQLESVVLGSMRPDTHLSFLCAHKTIGVPLCVFAVYRGVLIHHISSDFVGVGGSRVDPVV